MIGDRITHEVIGDEATFAALEPEWEDLFRRAEAPTPFLRHSWARLCWERQRKTAGTRLFVIVLREEGKLVLIAPLVTRPCGFLRRELAFLDSLTPQYNDVLVASGEASSYLAHLWDMIAAQPRLRRFAANWVRDDAAIAPTLAAAPSKIKAVFEAPFIDLAQFADWNDYFRSLSRNLRHDHRRRVRKLTEKGALFCLRDASRCEGDVAWLFAEKLKWLERTDTRSKWLRRAGTEQFFAAAAREGLATGRVRLFALAAEDGALIASALDLHEGATLYSSKSAYDPAWADCSPARTLRLLIIERAFAEDLRWFDLMIGADAWKKQMQTGAVAVRNRMIKLGGNPLRLKMGAVSGLLARARAFGTRRPRSTGTEQL